MKFFLSWSIRALVVFLCLFCFSCQPASPEETLVGYYRLKEDVVKVTDVQDHLEVPWEVQYNNGYLWYSLQKGEIWRMDLSTHAKKKILTVPDVFQRRTMGALGMAVDHYKDSTHVYLVYNQQTDTSRVDTSTLVTRLMQYAYDAASDTLVQPKELLHWTANTGHNGSRILVGPNRDLYITSGDIDGGLIAQYPLALNGKVLHVMMDGSVPANNPFPGSYVWSYGHRNQQGICFGANGLLYASEHGDAIEDEINLIEPGRNYGWPLVEGKLDEPAEIHKVDSFKVTVTDPLISWTPTIAPAAITYYGQGPIKDFQNSLLLVTLKGSALYVIHLDDSGRKVTGCDTYFQHSYGRLRSICIDDKGQVYIGTSNRDWNPAPGYPKPADDHILKITAADAGSIDPTQVQDALVKKEEASADKGKAVYLNYCSSCHKAGGEGLAGNFPPLKDNPTLTNNKKLIGILSYGRQGEQTILGKTYTESMPAFSFLTDEQLLDLVNYVKTHMVKDQPLYLADIKSLRANAQKP